MRICALGMVSHLEILFKPPRLEPEKLRTFLHLEKVFIPVVVRI